MEIKVKSNTIKVELDDRVFYVDFDENKKPLRIKERKENDKGYFKTTFWNTKTQQLGTEKSMSYKIVNKALNA